MRLIGKIESLCNIFMNNNEINDVLPHVTYCCIVSNNMLGIVHQGIQKDLTFVAAETEKFENQILISIAITGFLSTNRIRLITMHEIVYKWM